MSNKIRSSLYANPTYDWMVKDLGLSPAVSPAGELSATEMELLPECALSGDDFYLLCPPELLSMEEEDPMIEQVG